MPNNIDRNANSASRQRRNWQRLTQGAVTNTITTSAPITGGSTIGLDFDTNSGLGLSGDALVILFADPSIVGSASGIKSQLAASSALSTTVTGLTVLIDGSTITLNGAGQLQASTSGGGSGIPASTQLSTTAPLAGGGAISTGLTLSIPVASSTANGYLSSTDWTTFNGKNAPIVAADGTIVVGSSTGSTTLQVGTLTSTNLPGDVAYTDVANVFTSTQAMPNLAVSGAINLSTGSVINYSGTTVVLRADVAKTNFFGGGAGNSTAIGTGLTGFGFQALLANSTGTSNTAFGSGALQITSTGASNTAFGFRALQLNSTGSSNTAVGFMAGMRNTTGGQNTSVGQQAMTLTNTGSQNTAVGAGALVGNTTGSTNTAIGFASMQAGVSALENTAIGYQSLWKLTTGVRNIHVGANDTGTLSLTTGSDNILIGNSLAVLSPTGSTNLDIGNLIFGTGLTNGSTVSAGSVGIGIASPTQTLDVAGSIHAAAKVLASTGLGVGNSAVASSTVGALVGKFEIFDASGVSLGFVPIYSSIT